MIKFISYARDLVFFSLAPLVRKSRWAFLVLAFIYAYPGISSTFFTVAKKEQTTQINGTFVGPGKKMFVRSSQRSTRVRSDGGQVFECSCSADGFSNANCLSKNYEINEQAVKALTGKNVTLLLGPSTSLFGLSHLCYEILSEQKVWLSYEESAANYASQTNTFGENIFGKLLSWIFVMCISLFVLVRAFQFNGKKKGQADTLSHSRVQIQDVENKERL